MQVEGVSVRFVNIVTEACDPVEFLLIFDGVNTFEKA